MAKKPVKTKAASTKAGARKTAAQPRKPLSKRASALKAEALESKVAPQSRAINERGDTVTVACRLPHGFFMQLDDMVEITEPIIGTVKRAQPRPGARWRIRGYYDDSREVFGSAMPMPAQEGHFALTHGIPRDAWEEWKRTHYDLPMLQNGLVFAHDNGSAIEGMRQERKDVRSGLEPINPDKPPRDVRKITKMNMNDNA